MAKRRFLTELRIISVMLLLVLCSVTAYIIKLLLDPSPSTYILAVNSPVCGVWRATLGPKLSNGHLNKVIAVAENDAWAVGSKSSFFGYGQNEAFIERWNGDQWNIITTPNTNATESALQAVSAITANDIWAVGFSGSRTLIEHWNGTEWSIIASPNPGQSYNRLYGVAAIASNDVWAVGSYEGISGKGRTLTLHWDGSQWSAVPSPNIDSFYNQLYDVAAVSTSDVWAVGSTLMLHWDGKTWGSVPTPPDFCAMNSVSTIASNNVWAVGGTVECGLKVMRWNGQSWNTVLTKGITRLGLNYLSGVAAISQNNIWVVGRYYDGDEPKSIIAQWDGTNWSDVPIANPQANQDLEGIFALSSSSIWTTGYITNGEVSPNYAFVARFTSNPCPRPTKSRP